MTIIPVLKLFARLRPIGAQIGEIAVVLAALAQLLETIARVRDAQHRARAGGAPEPGEEEFYADDVFT